MKSRSSFRAAPDHPGAAALARAQRGTWVHAAVYPGRETARKAALHVPSAKGMPAYQPAGEFEAYAAGHPEGWSLWVRWVAGDEPVPDLPLTMAVRVAVRSEVPEHAGLGVITVTVAARCPQCGGPRGFDTVEPERIEEDGEMFAVDTWTNPCGHEETYAALLRESRTRPLPLPVARVEQRRAARPEPEAPAPDSPAGIILAAAAGWRGMHAAQAARLLAEVHGLTEEADLIREQIKTRRGHFSAKAAAHLLHSKDAR